MGSLDIYLSFPADFKIESKIYKTNQLVLSPQLEIDHVPIPNLEFGLFTNSYQKMLTYLSRQKVLHLPDSSERWLVEIVQYYRT